MKQSNVEKLWIEAEIDPFYLTTQNVEKFYHSISCPASVKQRDVDGSNREEERSGVLKGCVDVLAILFLQREYLRWLAWLWEVDVHSVSEFASGFLFRVHGMHR